VRDRFGRRYRDVGSQDQPIPSFGATANVDGVTFPAQEFSCFPRVTFVPEVEVVIDWMWLGQVRSRLCQRIEDLSVPGGQFRGGPSYRSRPDGIASSFPKAAPRL